MGVGEGESGKVRSESGWSGRNVVDKMTAVWQDGDMVIRSDDIEAKLQSLKAGSDRLDIAFGEAVVRAGFTNKYELFHLADDDA